MGSSWDPIETQDEYDLSLMMSGVDTMATRRRIQTFNRWARPLGLMHPAQINREVWNEFLNWLEHDACYQAEYQRHITEAVIRWLKWAHGQGYRGKVNLGALLDLQLILDTCQSHKLNLLSFPAGESGPHDFHMRELLLGLVFGEGFLPEELHEVKLSDYSQQSHKLRGTLLDPRTEVLLARFVGFRMRRGRNIKALFVNAAGEPLGGRAPRHRLNVMFHQVKPFQNPLRLPAWAPYVERDREPVLTELSRRPRPPGPQKMGNVIPADMVVKRLAATQTD